MNKQIDIYMNINGGLNIKLKKNQQETNENFQ